jgi:hypothetical protein
VRGDPKPASEPAGAQCVAQRCRAGRASLPAHVIEIGSVSTAADPTHEIGKRSADLVGAILL